MRNKRFPIAAATLLATVALVFSASAANAMSIMPRWRAWTRFRVVPFPITTTTTRPRPTTTTTRPPTTTTSTTVPPTTSTTVPPTTTTVPPTTTTTVPPVSSGDSVRRLIAANMVGFTGTQADAVALAQQVDILVSNLGQFQQYLPAMRAANPHLVMLMYMNGTPSQQGEQPNLAGSEFLLDAKGQRCISSWHNALMDPVNSDWIANRIAKARTAAGYDGVFLDVMGPAPVTPGYLSGLPINPRTGVTYTRADWLRDSSALANTIKASVPGTVVSNGLNSGQQFFSANAPTAVLGAAADGALAETWLRNAGSPLDSYPTLNAWLDNLNMLTANQSQQTYAMVKTWRSGTQAQIDAWHLFSLATYLLGSGPNTAYSFSSANTQAGVDGDSSLEHVNIGAPAGPYTASGGVYQRAFTSGLVLVNPVGPAVTVPVTGKCDLNGVPVSNVSLPANAAAILQNC